MSGRKGLIRKREKSAIDLCKQNLQIYAKRINLIKIFKQNTIREIVNLKLIRKILIFPKGNWVKKTQAKCL
jgi:hypothetical protein